MSTHLRYRLELALEEMRRLQGLSRHLHDRARAVERRVVRLEAWEAWAEATGEDPADGRLACPACFGQAARLDAPEVACPSCAGTGLADPPTVEAEPRPTDPDPTIPPRPAYGLAARRHP